MFFYEKNGAFEVYQPERSDYVDKSLSGFPYMR